MIQKPHKFTAYVTVYLMTAEKCVQSRQKFIIFEEKELLARAHAAREQPETQRFNPNAKDVAAVNKHTIFFFLYFNPGFCEFVKSAVSSHQLNSQHQIIWSNSGEIQLTADCRRNVICNCYVRKAHVSSVALDMAHVNRTESTEETGRLNATFITNIELDEIILLRLFVAAAAYFVCTSSYFM